MNAIQLGDTKSLTGLILVDNLNRDVVAIHTNIIKELENNLIFVELPQIENNRVDRTFVLDMLVQLNATNIKTIYIANNNYFKAFTGVSSVSNYFYEPIRCKVPNTHIDCVLGVSSYSTVFNPQLLHKMVSTLEIFRDVVCVKYVKKDFVIDKAVYIDRDDSVSLKRELEALMLYKVLTVDIEATGLSFDKDKIVSISLATSKTEGLAVVCESKESLQVLKEFFIAYEGTAVYHSSLFDLKFLVRHCFMQDENDRLGMLEGIRVLTKNLHDTLIMKYLATNNTQGNVLGLKQSVQEQFGNYEIGIKDASLVPVDELLEYNLKDTLATYWLFEELSHELIKEEQLDVYCDVFIKAIPGILEAMMVGIPMDTTILNDFSKELTSKIDSVEEYIHNSKYIQQVRDIKGINKERQQTMFPPLTTYNINSSIDNTMLFYEVLNFPINTYTKKGNPSTSGEAILAFETEDKEVKELLNHFKDFVDADKIKTTFLKAFNKYKVEKDDYTWLNGNHKLGGTLSGRLSSSEPNLANIPSNSKYGKDIKKIFKAPEGWLFCGADFSALEDRIISIISDDPNKKRIFTEGIDGHCLNAYAYYKDQMPDIDGTDSVSINSIKHKYPTLRQDSKNSTFALNYGGTASTLERNGLSPELAEQIEQSHKDTYKVLHNWSKDNLNKMAKTGYVTTAFGLKVRTPALTKCIINDSLPKIAAKEFLTANNAMSQSHSLMTTVSATEFRKRVEESDYRNDIFLVNFIHDAIYLIVRDDAEIVQWVNTHLIDCMVKSGDDQIRGNIEVPILANLEVGNSWGEMVELPEDSSIEHILEVLNKKKETK